MTVRALTIEEMLAQPDGSTAVLLGHWDTIPRGAVLTRSHDAFDDTESVLYSYDGGLSDEYFEEGEVGAVESVATATLGRLHMDFSKHMELFQPQPTAEALAENMRDTLDKEFLGVFRPELNSRKVGKIRVELVDDGFPLALREVANVMTWAQTAKGYKDHDWQNLPNAEIQLAAAASRHRTDHIKQRVVDQLDIDQCVDVESGLLHKAHEAFGVLSQLELMLRGKFVDSRPQVGV